eukprot:403369170
MQIKIKDILIKSSVFPIIFAALDFRWALLLSFLVLTFYKDLIGFITKLKPMPVMDLCTFFTSTNTNSNIMSVIYLEPLKTEKARQRISELMAKLPKMRYSIVDILGDYYYKELPQKGLIDVIFKELPKSEWLKNDDEINKYIQQTINIPFDFSRPQFQLIWQENYQNKFSVLIWKQHHSFCDGASIVSFINSTAEKYDIDALIPIKRISFWQKLFLRLSIPISFVNLFFSALSTRPKINPLHDGKRQLSGNRLCALGKFYEFSDVKQCARAQKITINDLITSCLSSSIKEYFVSKGDSRSDSINLVIPANIRFEHYKSLEELKLENKFAVVPLKIPLIEDINKSMKEIPKATKKLKTSFRDVYSTYFLTKLATKYFPSFFCQWYVNYTSQAFTMAFSNVPGILKPIYFKGAQHLRAQNYVQANGHCGMTVCIFTFVDKVRITVNVDDTIMQEPEVIIKLIEKYLDQCMSISGIQPNFENFEDSDGQEQIMTSPQQNDIKNSNNNQNSDYVLSTDTSIPNTPTKENSRFSSVK